MRFIEFASLLLLLFVFSGFKTISGEKGMKRVNYYYAGKFANPYFNGYVKVFVSIDNPGQVVGFNIDNGFAADYPATGTYSISGSVRYVSNFYGEDDQNPYLNIQSFNNVYQYTGNLIAP